MNVDTGQVLPFDNLTEEQKKSGKWKPLPEDISAEKVASLQAMNRKERRAALAKLRKEKK